MDPKYSNGKKHRDKKHQRETPTTDLIIDDEHLLMQNQQQLHRTPYNHFTNSGHFTNDSNDQFSDSNNRADEIGLAAKKKWRCMQCTYENWPSALKCTLCLNSKTTSSNQTTNTSTTTTSLTNLSGSNGTGNIKINRNSLKKINSLNNSFKNNNYNIYEPSSTTKTNNINNNKVSFNHIEILSEMVSVDANIGELLKHCIED